MRKFWLFSCLMFSLPAGAAECLTSSERYAERGAGAVQDKKTGLIWMRCPVGMSWDGTGCGGVADSYVWEDANAVPREFNTAEYAGATDWRLPTRDELMGLVEAKCSDPALSTVAFPNAPATGYWSSTEDASYRRGAFLVHFLFGRDYMGNKRQDWALRLVRGR